MGSILNDIQESAVGYGGEGGVKDEGEAEEVSEEVGAKRKKTNGDDDRIQKNSKRKCTPKKRET